MYDFNRKPEADKEQSWLLEKLTEAKTLDKLAALVAGVFSLPHPNHNCSLCYCRLLPLWIISMQKIQMAGAIKAASIFKKKG